jgi:transcriptional regulator with XRE-family HTH domain
VESLGEKLRSARESKGYTFDYVGRETNIATRYLEAFENENFSVFPGESYLVGFLRTYGEYLGLEAQELLSIYRAMKIQEQDVPVEQLLRSPSQLPRILITTALILVIAGAIGGAVYFFMRVSWKPPSTEPVVRPVTNYTLEGSSLERRFYRGDTVLIPLEGIQYKVELSNLGEAVTITAPGGQVILDLGQEETVDLNSNGIDDLRIGAADFVRNDPAMGVLLRLETIGDSGTFGEEENIEEPAGGESPAALTLTQEAAGGNAAAQAAIFASSNAYPFTLHSSFQGFCMFRWEILRERDRQERNERYYVRNDELNIQAQNGIRIWVSNAAAVKLEVIGGGRTVPLEIGGAGEVVVADVHWVRDDDGRYRLVLVRLD